MEAQLPYKSVVLFIACGTMVFLIVFIFVKRQITRFALKSKRVPHATIGASAPKSLRHEIEKRLTRVEDIKYEPVLLSDNIDSIPDYENCHFYYRMKAMDSLKLFDSELDKLFPGTKRSHCSPLRSFLLDEQLNEKGCLNGVKLDIVDKFAQKYEHARHDPTVFEEEQYQEYMTLLNQLIDHMRKRYSQLPSETARVDLPHTSPTTSCTTGAQLDPDAQTAAADLGTGTAAGETVHDTTVVYRGKGFRSSDSGTFLLTSRLSGSSQTSEGSTVQLETRFQATGAESHV